MKKILILFFTVSLMMISAPRESTDSRENIINHLDINYSYNIAESLTKFKTNEKLGFRTAGSSAEHAAGDMLYEEYKKLGLKNVRKALESYNKSLKINPDNIRIYFIAET